MKRVWLKMAALSFALRPGRLPSTADAEGAMKTLRGLACVLGIAMSFAGCAYTVEITQPAANATVPPGAPVSFAVTIHNADGRSFAAEMDGAAIPATDFTFTPSPPMPLGPFYPTQATLSRSVPPGSHTFRASATAAQLNVSSGSIASPFTVSFESVTVAGQPIPDLSFNVGFDLLTGPPVDVPGHGVWVVTAAPSDQIAGTVNVRCGIGSWGARCLSLGGYVTGTGATSGTTASGGR
jgi:hypothetical protein